MKMQLIYAKKCIKEWMQWPLRLVEFCDENVIGEKFTENGRVSFHRKCDRSTDSQIISIASKARAKAIG